MLLCILLYNLRRGIIGHAIDDKDFQFAGLVLLRQQPVENLGNICRFVANRDDDGKVNHSVILAFKSGGCKSTQEDCKVPFYLGGKG